MLRTGSCWLPKKAPRETWRVGDRYLILDAASNALRVSLFRKHSGERLQNERRGRGTGVENTP
jgi:hypothetical protein